MQSLKESSDSQPSPSRINQEYCRQHLRESVFRLQPQDYCKKHPRWPGMVGLEIEMLPVKVDSGEKPELVSLELGSFYLKQCLLKMAQHHPDWSSEFSSSESGNQSERARSLYRILLENKDNLTFEPGGQLEFSSVPYPCLGDALKRMTHIQSVLDEGLLAHGIKLFQTGINPWYSVDEIGLQMRKPRYQAMNEYFSSIGEFGQRMMRQTCTIQVNLDFGRSEHEMAGRYLLAQLTAPLATALFANSPFVQGKATIYKSFRAHCWHGVDSSRTGFPHLQDIAASRTRDPLIASYFDFAMAARVVFIEGLDWRPIKQSFTFCDWLERGYEGVFPNQQDWETHLSLLFPEVRARGFMELRSVDAQSRVWQSVPAAFYCGLLYHEPSMERALEVMRPYLPKLEKIWLSSAHGYKDDLVFELATRVADIAYAGFESLPSCFRDADTLRTFQRYVQHFVKHRRTPADDLLDVSREYGISATTLNVVEDRWKILAEV